MVMNMAVTVVVVAAIARASEHTARPGKDGAARASNNSARGAADQTTCQGAARGANHLIGSGACGQSEGRQCCDCDLTHNLPPCCGLMGRHSTIAPLSISLKRALAGFKRLTISVRP